MGTAILASLPLTTGRFYRTDLPGNAWGRLGILRLGDKLTAAPLTATQG